MFIDVLSYNHSIELINTGASTCLPNSNNQCVHAVYIISFPVKVTGKPIECFMRINKIVTK